MQDRPVFEITITSVENREWQGSVYFPATGERRPFQGLLELVRIVEHSGAAHSRAREDLQNK